MLLLIIHLKHLSVLLLSPSIPLFCLPVILVASQVLRYRTPPFIYKHCSPALPALCPLPCLLLSIPMALKPTLSLLLAMLAWTGSVGSSPALLHRPRERDRDLGSSVHFNIAVIYSGSSLHPEAAATSGAAGGGRAGGGRIPYPGMDLGRVSSSHGDSVVTQWGLANVIWLAINESSPRSLLLQMCQLLAARPLQGLVYEEERPPRAPKGPLAPLLEFVSAQTGLPIVAVGGGAGLGREPQVIFGILFSLVVPGSSCTVYVRECLWSWLVFACVGIPGTCVSVHLCVGIPVHVCVCVCGVFMHAGYIR